MFALKKHIIVLGLFLGWIGAALAQTEDLAQEYFEKGEYEKAESLYKSLSEKQPFQTTYFQNLILCQQALINLTKLKIPLKNNISNFQINIFSRWS